MSYPQDKEANLKMAKTFQMAEPTTQHLYNKTIIIIIIMMMMMMIMITTTYTGLLSKLVACV